MELTEQCAAVDTLSIHAPELPSARQMIDYVVDEITRWKSGRPARNGFTNEQLDRLA